MAIGDPEIQVLIDWSNDGDYLDTGEDVTSDVRSITKSHYRDFLTGYQAGAVLNLVLNNEDHKYSPSNGSSALTGKLLPGRKVWVRMWYPYDSFIGTANTALSSHTMDRDSGWAWVNRANVWELDGSGAARTDASGSGHIISTIEFSDTDVSVAGNYRRETASAYHSGMTFRYVDASNYGYIKISGSAIEIWKVIGTTATQISSTSYTWGATTTKFLQLWLHGDLAYIYVDNAVVVDGQSVADGGINAGTQHGLWSELPHVGNDHTWLDFGGYVSIFNGKLDRVRPRPSPVQEVAYVKGLDAFEAMRNAESHHENYEATAGGNIADTIGQIAAEYGVDGEGQRFDTGVALVTDVTTPFQGIKSADGDVLSLVQQYQDEENGFAYIDGMGYFVFEGDGHRDSHPHDAVITTIRDTYNGTDPGFLAQGVSWDDGWDSIENDVIIKVRRATQGSGGTLLWEHEQAKDTSVAIQFSALQARTFVAELTSHDYATVWDALGVGTDYAAFVNANGTGTNISAQLTVAQTDTGKFDGKFRKISVTFGATAGYLTKLQIKGTPLTLTDEMIIHDDDSTSLTAYGRRSKNITANWIDLDATARTQAAARIADRKDPKTELTIKLANADKPTMSAMIQRRISDRVTVVYGDMEINDPFFIEGEEWEIGDGGTRVVRTLQLRSV